MSDEGADLENSMQGQAILDTPAGQEGVQPIDYHEKFMEKFAERGEGERLAGMLTDEYNLYFGRRGDYGLITPIGHPVEHTGWKFHLSVDLEDLPRAWNIVCEELIDDVGYPHEAKMALPHTAERLSDPDYIQSGKMITLYCDKAIEPEHYQELLQKIEDRFAAEGIRPGVDVKLDRPVTGSQYVSYRNDKLSNGEYIRSRNIDGVASELTYNPGESPDPYRDFAIKSPEVSMPIFKPGEEPELDGHERPTADVDPDYHKPKYAAVNDIMHVANDTSEGAIKPYLDFIERSSVMMNDFAETSAGINQAERSLIVNKVEAGLKGYVAEDVYKPYIDAIKNGDLPPVTEEMRANCYGRVLDLEALKGTDIQSMSEGRSVVHQTTNSQAFYDDGSVYDRLSPKGGRYAINQDRAVVAEAGQIENPEKAMRAMHAGLEKEMKQMGREKAPSLNKLGEVDDEYGPVRPTQNSGSTYSAAYSDGAGNITTSNLGDSRVNVLIYNEETGFRAYQLTEDHDPKNPKEIERIEASKKGMISATGDRVALEGGSSKNMGVTAALGDEGMGDALRRKPEIATHNLRGEGFGLQAGERVYLMPETDGLAEVPLEERMAFLNEDWELSGRRTFNPGEIAENISSYIGTRSEDNQTFAVSEIDTESGKAHFTSVFDGHGEHGHLVADRAAQNVQAFAQQRLGADPDNMVRTTPPLQAPRLVDHGFTPEQIRQSVLANGAPSVAGVENYLQSQSVPIAPAMGARQSEPNPNIDAQEKPLSHDGSNDGVRHSVHPELEALLDQKLQSRDFFQMEGVFIRPPTEHIATIREALLQLPEAALRDFLHSDFRIVAGYEGSIRQRYEPLGQSPFSGSNVKGDNLAGIVWPKDTPFSDVHDGKPVVVICTDGSPSEVMATTRHEVAHAIDYINGRYTNFAPNLSPAFSQALQQYLDYKESGPATLQGFEGDRSFRHDHAPHYHSGLEMEISAELFNKYSAISAEHGPLHAEKFMTNNYPYVWEAYKAEIMPQIEESLRLKGLDINAQPIAVDKVANASFDATDPKLKVNQTFVDHFGAENIRGIDVSNTGAITIVVPEDFSRSRLAELGIRDVDTIPRNYNDLGQHIIEIKPKNLPDHLNIDHISSPPSTIVSNPVNQPASAPDTIGKQDWNRISKDGAVGLEVNVNHWPEDQRAGLLHALEQEGFKGEVSTSSVQNGDAVIRVMGAEQTLSIRDLQARSKPGPQGQAHANPNAEARAASVDNGSSAHVSRGGGHSDDGARITVSGADIPHAPSRIMGAFSGAGVGFGAYGLTQSIRHGDTAGMAVSGADVAVSSVDAGFDIARAVSKGSFVPTGALGNVAKFTPGLNIGVTVADIGYQTFTEEGNFIDEDGGLGYKSQRLIGSTIGGGVALGAGIAAGAVGATGAVVLAPVTLGVGTAMLAAEATTRVIDTQRAYDQFDKTMESVTEAKKFTQGEMGESPTLGNYQQSMMVMKRFSHYMRDSKLEGPVERDGEGRIRNIDEVLSNPENLQEFQRMIMAAKHETKGVIDENSSSLPRWLRSGDAVQAEQMAKGDMDMLENAEAELEMFRAELDAHERQQSQYVQEQNAEICEEEFAALGVQDEESVEAPEERSENHYYAAGQEIPRGQLGQNFEAQVAGPPAPEDSVAMDVEGPDIHGPPAPEQQVADASSEIHKPTAMSPPALG